MRRKFRGLEIGTQKTISETLWMEKNPRSHPSGQGVPASLHLLWKSVSVKVTVWNPNSEAEDLGSNSLLDTQDH